MFSETAKICPTLALVFDAGSHITTSSVSYHILVPAVEGTIGPTLTKVPFKISLHVYFKERITLNTLNTIYFNIIL